MYTYVVDVTIVVVYSLSFPPEMAFPACICGPQFSLKIDCSQLAVRRLYTTGVGKRSISSFKAMNTQLFGQRVVGLGAKLSRDWISIRGSPTPRQNARHFVLRGKGPGVHASWLASPQIASSVFTLGTIAVLPFYTLMVLALKAELTRKSMESNIPYVVLGLLYAYLLYLSWTPDTIRLMFASKYWLPELPGIAKMFSSEMTLASAWIHLLAVDLFAARQVFHDGLENRIETRHSVSLCLLFCPIGIVTHVITKALTKSDGNAEHSLR